MTIQQRYYKIHSKAVALRLHYKLHVHCLAVLASGVILTGSTPIYDLVNSKIIRRASENEPLIIPEGAVIIAGSRSVAGKSDFAKKEGLSLYTPTIIKYRDEKTDARTALEVALR